MLNASGLQLLASVAPPMSAAAADSDAADEADEAADPTAKLEKLLDGKTGALRCDDGISRGDALLWREHASALRLSRAC